MSEFLDDVEPLQVVLAKMTQLRDLARRRNDTSLAILLTQAIAWLLIADASLDKIISIQRVLDKPGKLPGDDLKTH